MAKKKAPKVVYKRGKTIVKTQTKPASEGQIGKAATGALLLGVPLGVISSAVGLSVDAVSAKKGVWQPPVIGWRGTFGLIMLTLGAIFRSPVFLVGGTMLFGTSLPQVTQSIVSAAGGERLPGISGMRGRLLPPGLRAAIRAALADSPAPAPVDENAVKEAVKEIVAQEMAQAA